MRITVRYFAAAREAAGVAEESVQGPSTLAELVAALAERHPALPAVLARCSFLVDEVSPGSRARADVRLVDGTTVDVLPPFAGG